MLCASEAGAQPRTWRYNGTGQWRESEDAPGPARTGNVPNKTLDKAERLTDSGRLEPAHDILLDWLKRTPKAPDRDRAVYLLAQVYYANGDRVWCFYECDELLDNYPDSRLFFPALRLQYQVADAFLNGYKKKFLGLAVVGMREEAIEMLFRIQERSPGSPIAERSLLRTADHYYHTSEFDLSADAYGAFLRTYPRSSQGPKARLRQAYSNFAQFRGPRYDATPLIDARAQFQDIIVRYPALAQEEGLQGFIDKIEDQLAQKVYIRADFYRRTHEPAAAVFVYRTLIQQYPNSRQAAAARKELSRMPRWALNHPEPPVMKK
ncbi:MAG TPA: outer membrane protein assembly factor BamD [Tepidisphaeraceae bacterium]|nr:outer membrane protein assembly factor BamD [Tepidisphaeraceae bacterium]